MRVDKLRDVDAALEVGGFIALQATELLRDRDALSGRIEVVGDVSDAHDGQLVTIRGDYSIPASKVLRFGIGLDTTYASSDYMDTYFSVDTGNASRSGLNTFNAGSGFKDIGLDLSAMYSVTERWGVLSLIRSTHIVNDASDSPIVNEGSVHQLFGGIAVSYRF